MFISQFIIGLFMLSNIHIGGPVKTPPSKADGFSHSVEKSIILEDYIP